MNAPATPKADRRTRRGKALRTFGAEAIAEVEAIAPAYFASPPPRRGRPKKGEPGEQLAIVVEVRR